jgi:hypothetical protein
MCSKMFSGLLGAPTPTVKPTPAVAIAPTPTTQQAVVKNPVSQIDTGFKPTGTGGSGRSGRVPGLGL